MCYNIRPKTLALAHYTEQCVVVVSYSAISVNYAHKMFIKLRNDTQHNETQHKHS
jgi:hypothetical protein